MRYFASQSADIVWQQAAAELIERPDYTLSGRKGDTREILPCVLRIQDPRRRWILSRRPPYNPAFGLVEFIWLITGNNESRVLNYWYPGLPKYSDPGVKHHGAYGYRLRHEFGVDQIKRAFDVLTHAPETRQAVLQIWKPEIDMPEWNGTPVSQDIPCNVMSLLKVRDGRLHWTQIMRSNDIMRGFPHNIIQFTMLQEVMAGWLGCELGEYFHLSDSLHIYERDVEAFLVEPTASSATERTHISLSYDQASELFTSIYEDLRVVADGNRDERQLRETFARESEKNRSRCDLIRDVMVVIGSDAARRRGFSDLAHEFVESCTDMDLRCAAMAWLIERESAE
jgi:thymidylate synthase